MTSWSAGEVKRFRVSITPEAMDGAGPLFCAVRAETFSDAVSEAVSQFPGARPLKIELTLCDERGEALL